MGNFPGSVNTRTLEAEKKQRNNELIQSLGRNKPGKPGFGGGADKEAKPPAAPKGLFAEYDRRPPARQLSPMAIPNPRGPGAAGLRQQDDEIMSMLDRYLGRK